MNVSPEIALTEFYQYFTRAYLQLGLIHYTISGYVNHDLIGKAQDSTQKFLDDVMEISKVQFYGRSTYTDTVIDAVVSVMDGNSGAKAAGKLGRAFISPTCVNAYLAQLVIDAPLYVKQLTESFPELTVSFDNALDDYLHELSLIRSHFITQAF